MNQKMLSLVVVTLLLHVRDRVRDDDLLGLPVRAQARLELLQVDHGGVEDLQTLELGVARNQGTDLKTGCILIDLNHI